jgi:uncharacterized protein (TIGR03067 family)
MKTLASLTLALMVVSFAAADDKKPEEKKKDFDAAKLVGDWTYVSGIKAGTKVEKEALAGKVTFTKDMITIPAGPDAKFLMSYKIDAKSTPAGLDMEIKDGPVKEGKAIGIISLDGDELKICYIPIMGKDVKRPTKFESTKDDGAFVFVLKRSK